MREQTTPDTDRHERLQGEAKSPGGAERHEGSSPSAMARSRSDVVCRSCRWAVAIVAFCLLFSSQISVSAQDVSIDYQLDSSTVEISFEYVQHQILVKGSAGGHRDLTFLFDTGATSPVLDPLLGVHGRHLEDTKVREAEGEIEAEAIQVNEMSVGSEGHAAHAKRIRVLLADLSHISGLLGRRIDGIMGATFVAGFVTEIDYNRHILRLHREGDNELPGREVDNERTFLFDLSPTSPFHRDSSMLIHGTIDPDYEYRFLLDTGYGGYVSVTDSAAEEAGMVDADTPRIRGTAYGLTRQFRTDKIRSRYLMLGNIDLSGKIISIDYRDGDVTGQFGIVGNLFLQNYHVTLDLHHRKLLLERATRSEEAEQEEGPSLGITLRLDHTRVQVDQVRPHSPAWLAGVSVGDTLTAIDEASVEEMTLNQVNARIASAHGGIRLRFQRRIDPNLGTGGGSYMKTLVPASPLNWKMEKTRWKVGL